MCVCRWIRSRISWHKLCYLSARQKRLRLLGKGWWKSSRMPCSRPRRSHSRRIVLTLIEMVQLDICSVCKAVVTKAPGALDKTVKMLHNHLEVLMLPVHPCQLSMASWTGGWRQDSRKNNTDFSSYRDWTIDATNVWFSHKACWPRGGQIDINSQNHGEID